MISGTHLAELVMAAPVYFDRAKANWEGVAEGLASEGLDPDSALAVTWCSLGKANIEALVDAPVAVIVFPTGIFASAGKRKLFGNGIKYSTVDFKKCRGFGPVDHEGERGFGKFCIEFVGAGQILLGRLQWTWRGKRFRDNRAEVMAVAEERDRIHKIISGLLV